MTAQEKQECLLYFWAKQPIGQAAEIRDNITTACHIKRCTWYHWLAGRVEIPDMAVDVIDKILGLEIFVKVSEKNQVVEYHRCRQSLEDMPDEDFFPY